MKKKVLQARIDSLIKTISTSPDTLFKKFLIDTLKLNQRIHCYLYGASYRQDCM